MTREEAFNIFCEEAEITDPITRELRVRPVFMSAWEICKENQRKIDIEKACGAYCKCCDTKECEEWGCECECNWVKNFRKAMEE